MACCDYLLVSLVALFISSGAFIYAFSISMTNGLQNYNGFLEYFHLGNDSENVSCTASSSLDDYANYILGTLTSFISLGAGIGPLLIAKPLDLLGRKLTIILAAALMILGTGIQSSAVEGAVWMLLLGRFVAGIGFGAQMVSGMVYVAEVAPRQIRGMLSSLIAGLSNSGGYIMGHVVSLLLFEKPIGWRIASLITLLSSIVLLIGLLFLPNTPRWLMLKGREREAREVLKSRIFKGNQDGVIEDIKKTINSNNFGLIQQLKLLFQWNNLKRLLLCLPINILTTAGGNFLLHYIATLFCSLIMSPFVVSIISTGLALIGTIITAGFIDKVGRRPMLVGSSFTLSIIAGSTAALIFFYNLDQEFHPIVSYVVVCLVCLFLLIYSFSLYAVGWVISNEVYPLESRGVSTALSISSVYWTNYILTQVFPFLLVSFNISGIIFMLALINLCTALFGLFLLPETKGISLEGMEELFAKPYLERVGLCQCFKFRKKKSPKCSSSVPAGVSAVNPMTVNEDNDVDVKLESQEMEVYHNQSTHGKNKDWNYDSVS